MPRSIALALALTGCGLRIGAKDVEVVDNARVQTQASFASLSQAGVNAAFTRQGVDPTHIESARLGSFSLKSLTANRDLSFFQKGTLFIQTTDADRVGIASVDGFPAGANPVDFGVVQGVELKPYVTAPTYQIVPELPFARPPPLTGVDVEARAVIHVEIKL